MNFKALINKRCSIREFENKTIPDSTIRKILDFYTNCDKFTDAKTKVMILEHDAVYPVIKDIAGYHNLMIDAPHYLLIFSEEQKDAMKNVAYIGEQLILKATELGVSNCWITLNDRALTKERLHASCELPLAALIALGYGEEKFKTVNPLKYGEAYINSNMEATSPFVSSRLAVEDIVFVDKWGEKADYSYIENSGLQEVFYYARLAPSALNLQPWRYLIAKNKLILAVKKSDSEYNDEISAGIQMLYFKLVFEQNLTAFEWTTGAPEGEFDIPGDYKAMAYTRI